jgi:hypothetical protein
LEILSTDSNRFSGKIPEEITQLGKVRVLALGRNNITGVFPSSIGNMHNLGMLSVREMKMSGVIPNSVYTLRKLKVLNPAKNSPGFEGTISTEIGNLHYLKRLLLFDNTLLSGTLPSELGKCRKLSELNSTTHTKMMTYSQCGSGSLQIPFRPKTQYHAHAAQPAAAIQQRCALQRIERKVYEYCVFTEVLTMPL